MQARDEALDIIETAFEALDKKYWKQIKAASGNEHKYKRDNLLNQVDALREVKKQLNLMVETTDD